MRTTIVYVACTLSLVGFGMQLNRTLQDPRPVVIYCQPACEMP